MGAVVLELLGGFALTAGDRIVPVFPTGQRLLAYLALQSRPVHRTHVADLLWPDATPARSGANLRTAICRTQHLQPGLIDTDGRHLRLAADVRVDVRAAHQLADRLLEFCPDDPALLHAEVRDVLADDLLPDWEDEEWLVVPREQFRQLRLHALEALVDGLIACGRTGEAVAAALTAVAAEPLRESAHRAVIRAHLAAGNRWAAARQYERCRCLFRDDLGLSPSPELLELSRSPGGVLSPFEWLTVTGAS